MKNILAIFANGFHRAEECGILVNGFNQKEAEDEPN